jgi:hypothetical protein
MQKAVVDLLALGPLPSERSVGADRRYADPAVIKQYETSILSLGVADHRVHSEHRQRMGQNSEATH